MKPSGTETHYTNLFNPDPRSRHIFNFPNPESLARVLRASETHPQSPTWRRRIAAIPNTDGYDLRPASRRVVETVEKYLQNNQHSRSLVQMATGAGKTRIAVTDSYRILKLGGFNRVPFHIHSDPDGQFPVRTG